MTNIGPTEPSADIRRAASAVRQIFVALVMEGFNETQALAIVGAILANQQREQ